MDTGRSIFTRLGNKEARKRQMWARKAEGGGGGMDGRVSFCNDLHCLNDDNDEKMTIKTYKYHDL